MLDLNGDVVDIKALVQFHRKSAKKIIVVRILSHNEMYRQSIGCRTERPDVQVMQSSNIRKARAPPSRLTYTGCGMTE